jgi:hypothetical protein
MGDQLLPLPLTERSIHLYVDLQRIFSAEGPRPTPSRDEVSRRSRQPSRIAIRQNWFHPLHSARGPGQRYYTRWRVVTRERLDPQRWT